MPLTPFDSLPINRNQTKSHLIKPGKGTPDQSNPILKRALGRLKSAIKYEQKNRLEALSDVRFESGDQWEEGDLTKRTQEGRPTLTFNVCGTFVRQIMGNIRMNKPRVKVVATGGPATREVASIYDGIIRKIEALSKADQVYDEVTKQMVIGGFGFMRVDQVYNNTEMFEHDLKISWIPNQFSVYFDPLPFDLDTQPAMWAGITSTMPREQFSEKYPSMAPMSLPELGTGDAGTWFKKDEVKIMEYFEREEYEDTLVQLSTGQTMSKDDAEAFIAQQELALNIASITNPKTAQIAPMLDAPKIVQERKVKRFHVYRYLMCGAGILEEVKEVPGELIPIIPVYGDTTIVDGERRYKGLIRDAKDPQRRLNYWVSTETEIVANQPRSPWMATAAQVKGHEQDFFDANKKNIPVILYNFVNEEDTGSPAPPPTRLPPIQPSPGMLAAANQALEDMKMAVGIFGPSLGQQPTRDTSGETMDRVQSAGDVNTFLYIDNLVRALRLLGRVLIGMIPIVYDTPRLVKFKNHMDEDMVVQVNWQEYDPTFNLPVIVNDLSLGQYDVEIIVGPPYQTARMEAKEELINFAKVFPAAAPALMDLVARTSDWPFAEELTRRLEMVMNPMFRKMKPGDPLPPPNPQLEVAKKELASRGQVADAKAMSAKFKALKDYVDLMKSKNADTKNIVLDTVEQILSGVQMDQQRQAGQPEQGMPPATPPTGMGPVPGI